MKDTVYHQARRQADRKIRFYVHLAVYLAVNTGLVLASLQGDPARTPWPLFGWGIGLLFHGLAVFLRAPRAAWKQRLIEKELHKLSR